MKRFRADGQWWVRCDCGHIQVVSREQYRGEEPFACDECGEVDFL